MNDAPDKYSVLSRYWGYDSFLPMQAEIVDSVLAGNDTIGLLPTGGGKSITFQVPALMMPGITIVVTPLVSLMKDQVDNLKHRNVPAACLYMGMTRHQADYIYERCLQGKIKLLYVAPERLERENFLAHFGRWDVSMIVVDEAHCISQWGYDFRPSYLRIRRLRQLKPGVPVLALTASATPEVVADIAAQLDMRSPRQFTLSFKRNNISFLVRHTDRKEAKLFEILQSVEGSGIVYVRSRKRTVELAAILSQGGISAAAYHAGLDISLKSKRQEAWKSGDIRVIVATTAFGMGIDKAEVRFVVHYDVPTTLEEYYQEAGRAGRDGLPSVAVMLADGRDRASLGRRLAEAFPDKAYIRRVYDEICRYLSVPMGEGFGALFEFDPEVMCVRYHLQPRMVMSAMGFLERAGYFTFIQELETRSRVMIRLQRHELYDLELDADEEALMHHLLRNYPGLFTDYVLVDEVLIASALNLTPDRVYKLMVALRRAHVIYYVPRTSTPYIYFTANRCESAEIILGREIYERRKQNMEKRIAAMKAFAYGDEHCRVATMLQYFGEEVAAGYACGKCDVCRGRRGKAPFSTATFEQWLYQAVDALPTGLPVADIERYFPRYAAEAADHVRALVERGELRLIDGCVKRC